MLILSPLKQGDDKSVSPRKWLEKKSFSQNDADYTTNRLAVTPWMLPITCYDILAKTGGEEWEVLWHYHPDWKNVPRMSASLIWFLLWRCSRESFRPESVHGGCKCQPRTCSPASKWWNMSISTWRLSHMATSGKKKYSSPQHDWEYVQTHKTGQDTHTCTHTSMNKNVCMCTYIDTSAQFLAHSKLINIIKKLHTSFQISTK